MPCVTCDVALSPREADTNICALCGEGPYCDDCDYYHGETHVDQFPELSPPKPTPMTERDLLVNLASLRQLAKAHGYQENGASLDFQDYPHVATGPRVTCWIHFTGIARHTTAPTAQEALDLMRRAIQDRKLEDL